jgi:predicted XRE-type DNA-binding protein
VKTSAIKRKKSRGGDNIRALLFDQVQARISELNLSRNDAAAIVNDAASQMSRLMTGHVEEFSTDRLVDFLLRLGCDVRVMVNRKKRGARGKVKLWSKSEIKKAGYRKSV